MGLREGCFIDAFEQGKMEAFSVTAYSIVE